MYTNLKLIRANKKAPQHIIDTAQYYLAILNTKDRYLFKPQIQSFVDKNKHYIL